MFFDLFKRKCQNKLKKNWKQILYDKKQNKYVFFYQIKKYLQNFSKYCNEILLKVSVIY